jgi:hypothetical protein
VSAYGATAANYAELVDQTGRVSYAVPQKTLTTVQIQAHGISIYQDFKAEFFADYAPYIFGGYNVVTPEDVGAIMINFCLYPR